MHSITKFIIFGVLIFSVEILNAQQKGFGPHGGRLKTVGNYQVELFGCDDYIEVYLFDKNTNTINNSNINGNVEFYYDQQATLISMLVRYGIDGFTAKIPVNTFLYCKPEIDINGDIIVTERFENECLKIKN